MLFRVFAENLIGLGVLYLVVSFLYKINPNPRAIICGGKKSGPKATFNLSFHWVGLALGWVVRRFHNICIYMFSNPTEFGKPQTPYWLNVWMIGLMVGWLVDVIGWLLVDWSVWLAGLLGS